MTPKERTAMQQALDTILNSIPHYPDEADEAITALREALEVTEASISDHKSEQVMVSVDFMRHLEARFSYYGELVDGEWGNCRDIEELDAAHLLPEEVYQIRKILEEAPVFGFTQAHTSDKPLHHYALVLRDLDKTVEGWCEEPEFYLNGERVYAEQAEQEPVTWEDMAFARLGVVRDKMRPDDVAVVQQFLDGDYAAPVRTKDLTDYFINELHKDAQDPISFARAVIAADREKNK